MSEFFYDFHTHDSRVLPGIIKMVCVKPGEISGASFAAGIHPWDTAGPGVEAQLKWLDDNAGKLIAIGEIGLDRLRGASLPEQIVIFRRQLEIAFDHKLPVIIHNVKCTPEILSMIKDPVRTLWHKAPTGTNNLHSIINSGATVSFSHKDLQHLNPDLVPLAQLGLETDDSGDDIREVYRTAAVLWQIPLDELMIRLKSNFIQLFGNY